MTKKIDIYTSNKSKQFSSHDERRIWFFSMPICLKEQKYISAALNMSFHVFHRKRSLLLSMEMTVFLLNMPILMRNWMNSTKSPCFSRLIPSPRLPLCSLPADVTGLTWPRGLVVTPWSPWSPHLGPSSLTTSHVSVSWNGSSRKMHLTEFYLSTLLKFLPSSQLCLTGSPRFLSCWTRQM